MLHVFVTCSGFKSDCVKTAPLCDTTVVVTPSFCFTNILRPITHAFPYYKSVCKTGGSGSAQLNSRMAIAGNRTWADFKDAIVAAT